MRSKYKRTEDFRKYSNCKPHKGSAKQCRSEHYFDYKKLYGDRLLTITSTAECRTLENCRIAQFGLCSYFGQVDPSTNKAHGVGIATGQTGDVHEGVFEEGKKGWPHLWTTKNRA